MSIVTKRHLRDIRFFAFAFMMVVAVLGSAGSPVNQKPFSIRQQNGITWLVKPSGEPFFSFGVCCVGMGISRKQYSKETPGYAAWQHYPDSRSWAKAASKRLESWGFTTVGGWSDFQSLQQYGHGNLAFAPVLHIGSTAGAPWWDMWDAKVIERMDQVAREQILALRDDPQVMGYYSDNEIGWWNAALFRMTLEQAPTSGQRQRLMDLLKETYHHDWTELLKDFQSEGASSWEELDRGGMLYLRPGGDGIRAMRQFLEVVAKRYYLLIHDIIRKYDSRALILGDRYQSFFYPEVARASAPYVDVVSTNLNASWNDGTFPHFYLDTLHALTGQPLVISEFYMAARENRSGNQNDHGIYPVVLTQKERAAGFRTTLLSLLKIPYVVGADWFQYYDEPTHGRSDGENFNFGLVDIHDLPYKELTTAAKALDLVSLKSQPDVSRLSASEGVPRARGNPLAQLRPTLALRDWDRRRGFVTPTSEFPLADLYICWSEKAIYLGLYSQDIVETAYYRDKIVPEVDRAEWTVSVGKPGGAIRARIGAGAKPIVDRAEVQIVNLSGVNLNVRNVVGMELPAAIFGKERLRSGDKIDFVSTLLTHCRAYRVEWRGSFTLK